MLKTVKKEVPDLVLEHDAENVTLKLYREQHPIDPLTHKSVVTLACSHRRYDLGDEDADTESHGSWSEVKGVIEDRHNVVAIKPLYLYDHSGITIDTSSFSSRWDSGQVGWAYITEESLDDVGVKDEHRDPDKLRAWIDDRVQEYDSYVRHEIYRYVLLEDGEEVDSCRGMHDCGGNAESEVLWDYVGYDRDEFEIVERA
jgi:hypothetical protein